MSNRIYLFPPHQIYQQNRYCWLPPLALTNTVKFEGMALNHLFEGISANGVPFSFYTYSKTISYLPFINLEKVHH